MTVGTLIKKFAKREAVPVDVNDVLAELRARGIEDNIYFCPVSLNPEVLRGMIEHYEEQVEDANGKKKWVGAVDISYHKDDDPAWQRLVCCKELLHVLDPDFCRTLTPEDVDELTKRLALSPEFQDPIEDDHKTLTDRIATFMAVAVLFPLAAREHFVAARAAGKITDAEIAKLTDLPQRYIALAMSDGWVKIHAVLASF